MIFFICSYHIWKLHRNRDLFKAYFIILYTKWSYFVSKTWFWDEKNKFARFLKVDLDSFNPCVKHILIKKTKQSKTKNVTITSNNDNNKQFTLRTLTGFINNYKVHYRDYDLSQIFMEIRGIAVFLYCCAL